MALTPFRAQPVKCWNGIGRNGFDETVIDGLEESFELNPNFESIYVVKDSSADGAMQFLYNPSLEDGMGYDKYMSWIYDGTTDRITVGRKYIQMYPYKTPVLEIGDYVCWDYYKTGRKSTWLCTALDSQTNYEQIGSIMLCTNEARFYNKYGRVVRVPCVFDNKINSDKDITLANLRYINGITTVYMQLNDDSAQIVPNTRFLFGRKGNWVAFRVGAIGVNNFMNQEFNNNESAHFMELTMEGNYVNSETDDIINGIADVPDITYQCNIDQISGILGGKYDIEAGLYNNGVLVSVDIVLAGSNDNVVSVNENHVMLVGIGQATVTVSFVENPDVKFDIQVIVNESTPDTRYRVDVSPNIESGILQGDTIKYNAVLYDNGSIVENANLFFSVVSGPIGCYKFSSGDGGFIVKNEKRSTQPLIIQCEYPDGQYKTEYSITLKGAW